MLVDNTVFLVTLVAITLVIIVLFALVADMLVEGKREKRLRAERNAEIAEVFRAAEAARQAPHKCVHSVGYLSELPRNQPIPDECLGCVVAIHCIRTQPQAAANPPTSYQQGSLKLR